MSTPLRIAVTPGEPAGIGPDLLVQIAQHAQPAELIAIADPALLEDRARRLGLPLQLNVLADAGRAGAGGASAAGQLSVLPVALAQQCEPGAPDPVNAGAILQTLKLGCKACMSGEFDALVTGPVNKHQINEGLRTGSHPRAGEHFSGHTEFFAQLTGTEQVVMMLATRMASGEPLRVALATTHLPLRDVPDAITGAGLHTILRILHQDLRDKFGIESPRIAVCGLNPHAGENGDLGCEDRDVITPCIDALAAGGMDVSGPIPADTAFTATHLARADATLAMYHDQGLPVLKSHGFGEAVNITLGLPIIRCSVDHGTAFDLAGTGNADAGSLRAAIDTAIALASARN